MSAAPPNSASIDSRISVTMQHVEMIHALAQGSDGLLVVASYGESPEGIKLPPNVEHFAIGNVTGMFATISRLARERHRNVYTPLAIFRKDLERHRKGSEQDIAAVFGIVADFDDADAAHYAERMPVPADYVLETSCKRFQGFILLDRPLPQVEAKRLASAVVKFAGCDNCSIDCSHVWRIAGTLNWPNRRKLDAGRPPEPQLVRVIKPWDGSLTSTEKLRALVGLVREMGNSESAPPPSCRPGTSPLPKIILDLLSTDVPKGERSDHVYLIARTMVEHGFNDDAITDAVLTCPAGVHFEGDRARALKDMQRSRTKGDGDVRCATSSAIRQQAWPDPLGEAAFHGLAGAIVRAIEPHTESDTAAVLVQLLVAFGNIVGRRNYYYVDGTRHHPNLNGVIVGDSAKARKGTGWARTREVFVGSNIEDNWITERIMNGLSSGEGLIEVVRDAVMKEEKNKGTGEFESTVVDPGVDDKRVLVIESEYARPLRAMGRPDNTLSAILRCAWDGTDLAIMTRKNPLRATSPHISLIGHVTVGDLRKHLNATEAANGFGNRNLYICAERSNVLPFGGDEVELRRALRPLQNDLKKTIERAGEQEPSGDDVAEREFIFDKDARARWEKVYPVLSAGRPGLLGAVIARAEAQVVRLALVYALFDQSGEFGARGVIKLPHLEAALALWRYAEQSAAFVFGNALGDAEADEVLLHLKRAGTKGLSRTDIGTAVYGHHVSAAGLRRALGVLVRHGLAVMEERRTAGRSVEIWCATEPPT